MNAYGFLTRMGDGAKARVTELIARENGFLIRCEGDAPALSGAGTYRVMGVEFSADLRYEDGCLLGAATDPRLI